MRRKTDFSDDEAGVAVRFSHEFYERQNRTEDFRNNGCPRRSRDAKAEDRDEEEIEEDVCDAAYNEYDKGAFAVAERTQNARSYVINKHWKGAGKKDSEVGYRKRKDVARCRYRFHRGSGSENAGNRHKDARPYRHRHSGVYGSAQLVFAFGAVKLRDYDRCAARYSEKKSYEEIDVDAASSAYGGKGCFAEKLPDDNGIDRIVQLLKKSAEENREKKRKERAPHRSCEDESGCALVAVARHAFYCTALLRLCPVCTKASVESEHAGHSL